MTELSPSAQTVLNAANMVFSQAGTTAQGIAAALRAAADQVVPVDNPRSFSTGAPQAFEIQRRTTRRQLLAIATELENHQ
jgi:hypothetical protein